MLFKRFTFITKVYTVLSPNGILYEVELFWPISRPFLYLENLYSFNLYHNTENILFHPFNKFPPPSKFVCNLIELSTQSPVFSMTLGHLLGQSTAPHVPRPYVFGQNPYWFSCIMGAKPHLTLKHTKSTFLNFPKTRVKPVSNFWNPKTLKLEEKEPGKVGVPKALQHPLSICWVFFLILHIPDPTGHG